MKLSILVLLFLAVFPTSAGVIGKGVTGTWQDHVECSVWATGLNIKDTLAENSDEHMVRARESGGFPTEAMDFYSVYFGALGKMKAVDQIYPRTRLYFDMDCQKTIGL